MTPTGRNDALRRLRLRALCCQCGQLRTVSGVYRRRDGNNAREGSHPKHWRMTTTLKCAHCAETTRHALLRDANDPGRDVGEKEFSRQREGTGSH